MKFRVYTAAGLDDYDLHENYPELMKYGHEFEIKKFNSKGVAIGKNYIHLYSLEELMELIEAFRSRTDDSTYDFNGIIVDINENKERSVMIYDDYIE